MTLVRNIAYTPKRLRRFNNGRGRLRYQRAVDLPRANQEAILGRQPVPALDYSPEDLITDLGAATVTQANGSATVAGIATAAQGGNPAVFSIGCEFDDDASGNLLAVESASHGFALDLEAGRRLRFNLDDSTNSFEGTADLPIATIAAGAIILAIDTVVHERVVVLYDAGGNEIFGIEAFEIPNISSWAGATVNCSYLAASSGIGTGNAPADGLLTTGNLSFWDNQELTGWS